MSHKDYKLISPPSPIKLNRHRLFQPSFTLAEVLITLGIIAIVATMTLPTIIQKQQTKAILTSLNKSYSELQNIVNLISNNYGEDVGVVVKQLDNNQLNQLFMSYYDNAQDCTDNTCFNGRNITYYNYVDIPLKSFAEGDKTINAYLSNQRFITKDGRLFIFGERAQHDINNGLIISVDVNGPFKKPNAWGRDTFSFKITQKQIKPCGGLVLCSNVYNFNCNSSQKGIYSGIGCTYYALTKKGFLDKKYYYDRYIQGEL